MFLTFINRLLVFSIPKSLVNAWTWTFNWLIAPSGIQYSRKPCECLDLDIQLAFHWELKSHLFKDWCFQLSHMSLEFGEVTWKAHIGRFSRRSWRCIWCLMLKCIFQKPIIFCWRKLKDVPYTVTCSQAHYRLLITTCWWFINRATSFSWHLGEHGFNTWHKSTTMWK